LNRRGWNREEDEFLYKEIHTHLKNAPLGDPDVVSAVNKAREALEASDIISEKLKDAVVSCIVYTAEEVAESVTPMTA